MKTLHREDIKAGIRKKFGTLSAFEQQRGLPKGAVKGVLIGKSSSRTVEAIADVLQLPVKVINASVRPSPVELSGQHKSPKVDLHCLNEASK